MFFFYFKFVELFIKITASLVEQNFLEGIVQQSTYCSPSSSLHRGSSNITDMDDDIRLFMMFRSATLAKVISLLDIFILWNFQRMYHHM